MSYNRYMSMQGGQSPDHYTGPVRVGDSFIQTPGGSVQMIDAGSPNAPVQYAPGQSPSYGYSPQSYGAGYCPDGYIYDGYSCAPYANYGPYGNPYNSPYFSQQCAPCAPCARPAAPVYRPPVARPPVRR